MADFVLAQRELEVPLPQFGGEPEITKTPLLSDYVRYIFNFVVGISGLIAFGVIVFGGIRYLTSAGNPTTMADAQNQIFSALIGLLVILGSYLLLTTINPQLIIISPQLEPAGLVVGEIPGVYLCKTDGEITPENCDGPYFSDSDALSSDFDNKTSYVKFINPEDTEYGVVLHEDPYLRGDCEVILTTGATGTIAIKKLRNKTSSINIFRQDKTIFGGSVTLCENKDCRKVNEDDEREAKRVFTFEEGLGTYKSSVLRGFPDLEEYKYDNGDTIDGGKDPRWDFWNIYDQGVSALEINKYIAILFRDDNYQGICTLFNSNDSDLGNDVIGNDKASSMMIIKGRK
jgi:hypothetical protein